MTRLRVVTQRRGLAAGAIAVLGVSACAGLVAVNGHDFEALDDRDSLTAGVFPDLRTGTTYPDAAALQTIAAERSHPAADRGHGRTSPSQEVSGSSTPQAEPVPQAGTPIAPDAAPQDAPPAAPPAGKDAPERAADPAAAADPDPTASPAPQSAPSSPEQSSGSAPAPAPAPAGGPETTAVTDLAAAGTWTVVLTSDTVASFECSLDGGAWTPCGPVATFTGLSKGKHTLAVRAVDGSGTADSTPAHLSTTMSGALL